MAAISGRGVILKTGYLHKQGGSYKSWKKRYFMLKDSSLQYYQNEGDATPKGSIDLTTGLGVRDRNCCQLEWPNEAKPGISFGVATESRTYYMYGSGKAAVRDWMTTIQQIIEKVGKPSGQWRDDPEGKPESAVSKAVRQTAKLASQVTKLVVKESGLVDEETAEIVGGAADAVQNQAEASRDATIADRLKMAGGDTAGIVADNVDNEIVQVGASVVQEQCEADGDTSLQQRMLMATGTAMEGTSELVDNEVAAGVLGTAAGVAHDQADADEEMSLQQRLILAGGSVLEGTSEMVDNEVISGAMEVGGTVVKDQAEADEDASLRERAGLATGSATSGVLELDSVKHNSNAATVCKTAGTVIKNVQENMVNEGGEREEQNG